MKHTIPILILALLLSGCATRLPQIGDHKEGRLLDGTVVRFEDAKGVTVPFRIYPIVLEADSPDKVAFSIEIDGPIVELFGVSLATGNIKRPDLVAHLSTEADESGVYAAMFSVARGFPKDLWLTFGLKPKAKDEKGIIYTLDLKSWPIIVADKERNRREEKWPNKAMEPTPVSVTIPAAQEVAPLTSAAHL